MISPTDCLCRTLFKGWVQDQASQYDALGPKSCSYIATVIPSIPALACRCCRRNVRSSAADMVQQGGEPGLGGSTSRRVRIVRRTAFSVAQMAADSLCLTGISIVSLICIMRLWPAGELIVSQLKPGTVAMEAYGGPGTPDAISKPTDRRRDHPDNPASRPVPSARSDIERFYDRYYD